MRRSLAVALYAFAVVTTAGVTPLAGPRSALAVSQAATATLTATIVAPPIGGTVVTATPSVTATAPLPSATLTPRATGTVTNTMTATPTRTAVPTRTPTRTPIPTRTPNPHPGLGAAPWSAGEYYVWTLKGPHVSGTAWQLITHQGHEWVDQSALQERAYGTLTTFASRLSFDANSYRLRRYDGVEDAPASVLRVTLAGQRLSYTSYQGWGRRGCTAAGRIVPANTLAYGMMADLLRTTALRKGQGGPYAVFDPYGSRPIATASYVVTATQTLSTSIGRIAAVGVYFWEGAQPPLDIWYSAAGAHTVVQWSTPGVVTATLTHYEASSARKILPVAVPTVKLTGRDAACL